jgi:NAD(P)-dependent dehydrogenase (short-subunit alcohol dehydrogenase family)
MNNELYKTVLITGANGNLGTAVVKKFLNSGHTVIAVDGSDTHLQFAKTNSNFQFKSIDLKDEVATSAFIEETIATYGSIDAALLLVGGFAMGSIEETETNAIKEMISLNFETAYNAARPVFRSMIEKNNGRIVFVGARPALKPEQGKKMIAYSLGKSLLFRLAELMNAEAKGKNVVASVIVPSTIDTPANRQSMPNANPADWVTPAQIADTLDFICNERGNPLRETVLKLYNNS